MTRLSDLTAAAWRTIRSELAALGYDGPEIHRVEQYHERWGTFRGCPGLYPLDAILADILLSKARPMAAMEEKACARL